MQVGSIRWGLRAAALAVVAIGWLAFPAGGLAGRVALCSDHEPATLAGTNGDDVLTGTPGPDVIVALGGDDSVRGLGGGDIVCAGDGRDRIEGGPGCDRIWGGHGDDVILAGGCPGQFGELGIGGRGEDRICGG